MVTDGPGWKEEQDETDACCRRLEAELGDVLFDALLLARKFEVATAGKLSLGGAMAVAAEKVRRRTPHVFAGEPAPTRADAEGVWQREKKKERQRVVIDVEEAAAPAPEPAALSSSKGQNIKVVVEEDSDDDDTEDEPIVDLASAARSMGTTVEQVMTMSKGALDEQLEDLLGVKRPVRRHICSELQQMQSMAAAPAPAPAPAPAAAPAPALTPPASPRSKVREEMLAAEAGGGDAAGLKERGAKAFKAKQVRL